MMLRRSAAISFCMRSRNVDVSSPTVRRPFRSRRTMASCSRCWMSRLMSLEGAIPGPLRLNRHFKAEYGFNILNRHHLDGIPRAAVQEGAIGALANALFAADAQDWIDFDSAEW